MNITLIPALGDNYIYLISWENKGIVIDPAEASPVLTEIQNKQITLRAILNTHHHSDHVGGNEQIKEQTNSPIIGPDDRRIPGLDQVAKEGEAVSIDGITFQVLSVPGHTTSHIAFYLPEMKWLFSGDSLFAGGCGRIFEGTYEQMLTSLKKIATLPEDTQVFCGHEYTQNNLEFALSIEPNNPAIQQRLANVKQKRSQHQPTIPSTLAEELLTNPFLRSNDPALKQALGMENATELEVFTKVRQLKDSY